MWHSMYDDVLHPIWTQLPPHKKKQMNAHAHAMQIHPSMRAFAPPGTITADYYYWLLLTITTGRWTHTHTLCKCTLPCEPSLHLACPAPGPSFPCLQIWHSGILCRHIWKPRTGVLLLTITADYYYWLLLLTITTDGYYWLLLLTITTDYYYRRLLCYRRLLLTITIDYYYWLLLLTITTDYYYWLSLLTITTDSNYWLLLLTITTDITTDFYNRLLLLGHPLPPHMEAAHGHVLIVSFAISIGLFCHSIGLFRHTDTRI